MQGLLVEKIWGEKHRPHKISDTVLPKRLKDIFQGYVDNKFVPNMTLAGPPGTGKTTVARALLEQIDADYIIINASLYGNIDLLRNDLLQYVTSVSFTGKKKYVILDEADYLNASSTQPALRNFIEQHSKNCGFILTANYKNRLIPALHSRAPVIDFVIEPKEKVKLASQFLKRLEAILTEENVPFDKRSLVAVIENFFPDWRQIINVLQQYASTGAIDSGVITFASNESIRTVLGFCKDKKFDDVRKWVHDNNDLTCDIIFSHVYDLAPLIITKRSIAKLILLINDYQYKSAFVANHSINILAFFVECMIDLEYV